ncbi:MAG: hypothetical protein LBI26_01620 [Holosporales bacterium]|jgi:DNA polymerase-1|nr:hypothetical protein [Holosporales bacterium]
MKIVNLLDISGFIYRVFYAYPSLTYNGLEVGALYGYSRTMLDLIKRFPSAMFIAAFDSARKTFRNEMYSDYKSNRKSMPDALRSQIPLIKEATYHFGFYMVEHSGSEADDIIASYVKKLKGGDFVINVMSSDKDLMQLLDSDNNVNIYDPVKQKTITSQYVFEKFGVNDPKKIADILALSGDASDNIPGCPGIGPKTAASLINEYGNLKNLIDNIEKLPNSKKFDVLRDNVDKVLLSEKLVKLQNDIELNFEYKQNIYNNLIEFFNKFEFDSLIKKVYV